MTQDRVWAILGVLIGLIGAVATIVIYSLTERGQTKQLQVTVISASGLINPDIGSARSRLKILYEGREVSNVSVIDLRFTNSGGQPIRSADIEEPIAIQISNGLQIITADIIKTKPADLSVLPKISGHAVTLTKALLNPGDEFTLEITGVPEVGKELVVKQVDARIVGMPNVKFQSSLPSTSGKKSIRNGSILALVSGLVASTLSALTSLIGRRKYWRAVGSSSAPQNN